MSMIGCKSRQVITWTNQIQSFEMLCHARWPVGGRSGRDGLDRAARVKCGVGAILDEGGPVSSG
jgi:hypothetical protein